MMKKHYILTLLIFACLTKNAYTQSPNWQWTKSIDATRAAQGNSIAVDLAGNVYTTGIFDDTCDFDPGPGVFNLISVGNFDVFVSKLDSSGNFIWAKSFGGTGVDRGVNLAVDEFGNVHITGNFEGSVDFDPGPGIYNLTSAGNRDVFICKLDSSGDFEWAKAFGGLGIEEGNSVTLDPSGSGYVYTTGIFSGTVDFDPGPGIFNLNGNNGGIFISKLDSAGNFIWAKAMAGTSGNWGRSICIDNSGNVYTTGYFNGITDFDPDTSIYYMSTSSFPNDVFISKLDSTGNFIWAKQLGGSGQDYGFSITVDSLHNVYTIGYFNGTADFDPGIGVFNLTATGSLSDIFVSKLDSTGNFIWAFSIGGLNNDYGYAIALDAYENVFVSGAFTTTTDFDPGSGVSSVTSAGGEDLFIAKYDSSGNFKWVKTAGGPLDDYCTSIALDGTNTAHLAGYFKSPSIVFGTTTLFNSAFAINGSDVFVAKLDSETITSIYNETESIGNNVSIFPNPATNQISITFGSNNKNVEIAITDLTGKIVFKNTANEAHDVLVDIKDFSKGIYFVIINTTGRIETKKLIIID